MNFRILLVTLFCLFAMNAYAITDKPTRDEATVVGACMVQKFTQHTPPIPQDKINKCANAVANAVPKCLGLNETEYEDIIKSCFVQLGTDKCVAGRMNVPLLKYVTCEYEKDSVACYKRLGFTQDQVTEMSNECQKM